MKPFEIQRINVSKRLQIYGLHLKDREFIASCSSHRVSLILTPKRRLAHEDFRASLLKLSCKQYQKIYLSLSYKYPVPRTPFVVMVIHNDGGRIFEELPAAHGEARDAVERHLVTSHGADFEHAARFFGWRFRRVASPGDLPGSLAGAYDEAAPTLVEVRSDARAGLEARRRIQDETARLLEPAARHPERTRS